jgi:hypothetical protein
MPAVLTILGAIALVAAVYAIGWWLVNRGNPVLRYLGRHPRLRFAAIVAVAVAIGVLAFLVLFYPERLFGVEGKQLGSSLAREVKRGEGGDCRPSGTTYRCGVDVGGKSEASSRAFELEFDGDACWTATPAQEGKAPEARSGEELSGCVGLLDFVAPKGRGFSD